MADPIYALDDYGLLRIPAPTPASVDDTTPVGDPGLAVLGQYLQAFLNKYGAGMCGVPTNDPIVREVLYYDPERNGFIDSDLPALFLWRGGSMARPEWVCEDMRVSTEQIFVHWVTPWGPVDDLAKREPFYNVIAKCIDDAIAHERDACFTMPGDTMPGADVWGTHIWTALKAWSLEVVSSRPKDVRVKMLDKSAQTNAYHGVLVTVEIQEQLAWNHDNYDPTDEMRGAISNASKNDEADPAGAMKLVDWVISST